MLVFEKKGKLKNLEKKPWNKNEKQQKTDISQMKLSQGLKPRPH